MAEAWPRMELGMISWIAAGATPKGMLRQNTVGAISRATRLASSSSGKVTDSGSARQAASRPTRMLASVLPRLAQRSARRPPKTMPRQPNTATMLPYTTPTWPASQP